MNKELRPNLKIDHLLAWITSIILSSSLLSFTGDKPDSKRTDNEYLKRRHRYANNQPITPHFNSDPIRFTLRAEKKQVSLGDEVTFTITAHYLNISPALLFTAEGSNAFRLKLLLPDGFVQTGGSYSDYVGTELSTAKAIVSYTLKGYFTKVLNRNEFRLLRGSGSANETSLFVEKAILSISVNDHVDQNKNGRLASNCDYTEGQFLLNWYGEQIYAHYYNGILFASYQDPSLGFKPQSWLQVAGFDGSKLSCFATIDPHTDGYYTSTNPSFTYYPSHDDDYDQPSFSSTGGLGNSTVNNSYLPSSLTPCTADLKQVFTRGLSIDRYYENELQAMANTILNKLGLTSINQLEQPPFLPIFQLDGLNQMIQVSHGILL